MQFVNAEGQELFVGQLVVIKDWRLDKELPAAGISPTDKDRLPMIGCRGRITSLTYSTHWRSPLVYLTGLPRLSGGQKSDNVIWLGRWVGVEPAGLKQLVKRYREVYAPMGS